MLLNTLRWPKNSKTLVYSVRNTFDKRKEGCTVFVLLRCRRPPTSTRPHSAPYLPHTRSYSTATQMPVNFSSRIIWLKEIFLLAETSFIWASWCRFSLVHLSFLIITYNNDYYFWAVYYQCCVKFLLVPSICVQTCLHVSVITPFPTQCWTIFSMFPFPASVQTLIPNKSHILILKNCFLASYLENWLKIFSFPHSQVHKYFF